jgi:hypothetical protein
VESGNEQIAIRASGPEVCCVLADDEALRLLRLPMIRFSRSDVV